MYKVMIDCEVGTWRLVGDYCWERVRHVITWAHYDTYGEAYQVARDIQIGGRNVQSWVEPCS